MIGACHGKKKSAIWNSQIDGVVSVCVMSLAGSRNRIGVPPLAMIRGLWNKIEGEGNLRGLDRYEECFRSTADFTCNGFTTQALDLLDDPGTLCAGNNGRDAVACPSGSCSSAVISSARPPSPSVICPSSSHSPMAANIGRRRSRKGWSRGRRESSLARREERATYRQDQDEAQNNCRPTRFLLSHRAPPVCYAGSLIFRNRPPS